MKGTKQFPVGVKAVGTYIPGGRVDNVARCADFDKDADFIENKIGFKYLSRKAPDEETSDLCVKAYNDLLTQINIPADNIDCLIVCTQNPDVAGLPHTSAIVHEKLGLGTTVAAFDISLGCSGYVYGLSIIRSFMEMNGLNTGLLFTADPYSKILNPLDHTTELLFGDGATVTLLTRDADCYYLAQSQFSTDGKGGMSIYVDKDDCKLHMKGRAVFMFTMKVVPQQIKACLAANHSTIDDIEYFLLHQGSKYIVDNMIECLGIPVDKAPFMAADYGNTISSSIPMMLKSVLEKRPGKIIISGFGVGLSWATSLLYRTQDI